MRSKTFIYIFVSIASILALVLFWQQNGRDEANSGVGSSDRRKATDQIAGSKINLPRRSLQKEKPASSVSVADARTDNHAAKVDGNSARPSPTYEHPVEESLKKFDQLLSTTSPLEAAELRRMLTAARLIEETKLAAFLVKKLSDVNLSLHERGNVIFVATKLNAKTMFPVWHGLLTREFPAFADELSDWSKWMRDHRNEHLRLMQAEQLRALGGIGALQLSDENSRDFMYRFALKDIEVPGDLTMLRFEAARQMQQHNKTSLVKLAKILSANDPLRTQLSVYANAKREQK